MAVHIDLEEDTREVKRILFSREDDITAEAHFSKGLRRRATVFVVNISVQGVGLLIGRHRSRAVAAGDRMVLTGIATPEPLGVIREAVVEVKYVLADDALDYATLGCVFTEIEPAFQRGIKRFVDYMLNEVGSELYRKPHDIKHDIDY